MTEENKETNLNEMLNTEEISEESETAPLADVAVAEPETQEATVEQAAEATTEEEGSAEDSLTDGISWISLFDYMNQHNDKITNAGITNIEGFARVPNGKYIMFCTNEEDNADLILFDKPSTLWMDPSLEPEAIKVENSGLIIRGNNHRIYIGKNNITKIELQDGSVSSISTISRAKDAASVKVSDSETERRELEVDEIKLHVKRVSPRLYAVVKEASTKEEIKTGIEEFMGKIYDLNHLIKIEKELLLACSL